MNSPTLVKIDYFVGFCHELCVGEAFFDDGEVFFEASDRDGGEGLVVVANLTQSGLTALAQAQESIPPVSDIQEVYGSPGVNDAPIVGFTLMEEGQMYETSWDYLFGFSSGVVPAEFEALDEFATKIVAALFDCDDNDLLTIQVCEPA